MNELPEKIGDYEITRELGRGAMGVVYLATHPTLSRQVAIKVMASELARDQEFLERFRREGEAAAKLRHPNIVQVFDFVCRDNTYFIVMEYLGDRTLKDLLLDEGGQPLAKVCTIMDELLSALELAHSKGVIHRDIKPANVMIGDEGSIALTDFSVARMKDSVKITQTGSVVGTPEYMAPEQFDGMWDARSDLYAAGIVFYELLTGISPFRSATITEVMRKQLFAVPDPLSQLDFTVPEAVSAIVSRALEKEPDNRFASAKEMQLALREAVKVSSQTKPLILDAKTKVDGGPEPLLKPIKTEAYEQSRAKIKASLIQKAEPPALSKAPQSSEAAISPPQDPGQAVPEPLRPQKEGVVAAVTANPKAFKMPPYRMIAGVALMLFGVLTLFFMAIKSDQPSGSVAAQADNTISPSPVAVNSPVESQSPSFKVPAWVGEDDEPEAESSDLHNIGEAVAPLAQTQSSSSTSYPKEGLIYPGVGVGAVKIGDLQELVVAAWGPPYVKGSMGGMSIWQYGQGEGDLAVCFKPNSRKVVLIIAGLKGFQVEGAPSCHPGVGTAQIEDSLGPPTYTQANYWYYLDDGLMITLVKGNVCQSISVFDPSNPPF